MKKDLFFTSQPSTPEPQRSVPVESSPEETQAEQSAQEEAMRVDLPSEESQVATSDAKQVAEEETIAPPVNEQAVEEQEGTLRPEEVLEEKLAEVDEPNAPVKKIVAPTSKRRQRAGSRLSFKGVMIGCIAFLMLIVGGLSFVFYSMLSDPSQQRTIIPRQSAQDLLIIFAWVFFVIIFFVGVFFFAVNGTRLLSKKSGKKFSYALGALIGIIMIFAAVGGGIPTITSISQAGETRIDRIVDPYVLLPEGPVLASSNPRVLLIAPSRIFYQLNSEVYNSRVLLPLGSPDVTSLQLNCGNDQELAYDAESGGFDACLYTEKKSYPVSLNVQYVDRQTGETKLDTIKLADIAMDAQIDFEVVDGEVTTNDAANEIHLGDAPVKLRLDAQDIVTAFGLVTNDINRDLNDDNIFEVEKTAVVKEQFLRSQLYEINYQLPSLSPYTYGVQARVLQPDTPVCQVAVTQQSDSVYRFDVEFVEGNERISQYAFAVKDLDSGSVVEEQKIRSNSLQYDFARGGEYAIRVSFITQDGKTSSCESDDFMVGDVAYEVSYDVIARSPLDPGFLAVDEGSVTENEEGLRITQLPTTIRLSNIQVFPRTVATEVTVLIDGQAVLEGSEGTYDVLIETQGEHTIQIQSKDQQTQQSTIVETINIVTDLEGVIGKLLIRPDTVGSEPFEVEFDASTTTINDPDDEVVYFTWDFGDGEIKKNINQAIIKHTYYFDEETAEGTYFPTLMITTRKGREITVQTESPIIVKRSLRDARLSIDTHPGQVAQRGETVRFSLSADGIPSRVTWTFSPTDTLECAARECTEAIRTFTEAGNYNIQVRVEYEDHPDVIDSIDLLVQ